MRITAGRRPSALAVGMISELFGFYQIYNINVILSVCFLRHKSCYLCLYFRIGRKKTLILWYAVEGISLIVSTVLLTLFGRLDFIIFVLLLFSCTKHVITYHFKYAIIGLLVSFTGRNYFV